MMQEHKLTKSGQGFVIELSVIQSVAVGEEGERLLELLCSISGGIDEDWAFLFCYGEHRLT